MNKEIQFLMYSTSQGDVNVEAVVRDETLWLYSKTFPRNTASFFCFFESGLYFII